MLMPSITSKTIPTEMSACSMKMSANHKYSGHSRKISKDKGYKCLGIWICPFGGCDYRFCPRAPQRGQDKYTTGNKLPEPQRTNQCKQHHLPLSHIACNCKWKLVKSVVGDWEGEGDGARETPPEGNHNGWYCHHVCEGITITRLLFPREQPTKLLTI